MMPSMTRARQLTAAEVVEKIREQGGFATIRSLTKGSVVPASTGLDVPESELRRALAEAVDVGALRRGTVRNGSRVTESWKLVSQ